MKRKSKFFTALVILISLLSLTCLLCKYFKPANGTVVDADTGLPIKGAIISRWTPGLPIWWGGWKYNAERVTDENGKYHFHGLFVMRPFLALAPGGGESFLVYKEGYAACGTDAVCGGDLTDGTEIGSFYGVDQQYTSKNCVIKLRHLPSDNPEFHEKNSSWIGSYGGPSWAMGPLTEASLKIEREKANRKKTQINNY